MNASAPSSGREDFLLRIEQQFEELAAEISLPFEAVPWAADNRAGLRITGPDGDGGMVEVQELVVRFEQAGDDREGWHEKLSLEAGDAGEILALGWTESSPDALAGLDSLADHAEGECSGAMGQVTRLLRSKLASLKGEPGFVSQLPVRRLRREPLSATEVLHDGRESEARRTKPAKVQADSKPVIAAEESDFAVLQASLGELATRGGLRAEKVFAVFIKAAREGARLQQGNVRMSVQRAMLRLYLFQKAYLEQPILRPARMRSEDGPLVDTVLAQEAALYQQPGAVQDNVAGEMVLAMRAFYETALRRKGVADDVASEMIKSAFANVGGIVKAAVDGFQASLPRSWTRFTRLLARPSSLE